MYLILCLFFMKTALNATQKTQLNKQFKLPLIANRIYTLYLKKCMLLMWLKVTLLPGYSEFLLMFIAHY